MLSRRQLFTPRHNDGDIADRKLYRGVAPVSPAGNTPEEHSRILPSSRDAEAPWRSELQRLDSPTARGALRNMSLSRSDDSVAGIGVARQESTPSSLATKTSMIFRNTRVAGKVKCNLQGVGPCSAPRRLPHVFDAAKAAFPFGNSFLDPKPPQETRTATPTSRGTLSVNPAGVGSHHLINGGTMHRECAGPRPMAARVGHQSNAVWIKTGSRRRIARRQCWCGSHLDIAEQPDFTLRTDSRSLLGRTHGRIPNGQRFVAARTARRRCNRQFNASAFLRCGDRQDRGGGA